MTEIGSPEPRRNALEQHLWQVWWAGLAPWQVNLQLAQQEFERLVQEYGTIGRYYHTLTHVQQVLQTISHLQAHTPHPEIVQLAGWFHDVVYDPRSQDNEDQSATYAAVSMERLGLPSPWVFPVQQLIRATRSHASETQDPNIQVLLDADLAILGSTAAEYALYAHAIRQEYAWVPDERYRQGRSRILSQFLQRPSLYFTAPMQPLTVQAHINLKTELQQLCA